MLYQVNGWGDDGRRYSTRITAKNPKQAAKLAIGSIIKEIAHVTSLDKKGFPVNSWNMENGKLIKIL